MVNDPEYWRDRAREKRELAERLRNEQAKQTVLRVANEYERLAEQAEERSRGSPPPRAAMIYPKMGGKATPPHAS